jgi:hypothetical protein
MAVNIKNIVFWNMTLCSMVDRYQCFRHMEMEAGFPTRIYVIRCQIPGVQIL